MLLGHQRLIPGSLTWDGVDCRLQAAGANTAPRPIRHRKSVILQAVNELTQLPAILVTGAHRSGTSWVGRMLAANGQAELINEPFNRFHPAGVMRAPIRLLYTYVCQENEAEFLNPMREMLGYRYHYWAQLRRHPVKDIPRAVRDAIGFLGARLHGRRPLVKDPFAVFSVPWFADRLHCQVVIVVRHPVAFASSLKRLEWSFDFGDLLAQPMLMNQLLASYRAEMELLQRQPGDLIGQATLLWRIIYGTVAHYRVTHPEITIVRHEDLSLDPEAGFRQLYAALGLSFTASAQGVVLSSSMENNPTELSPGNPHASRLNSRANLQNWKHRLTSEEVDRVLKGTQEIVPLFYSGSMQGFDFARAGTPGESRLG